MSHLGWLTSTWLRRRALAMIPFALLVAVGATGTVLALAAGARTQSAYGDHLRRANVGDVVVNPSLATREIDAVVRALPGLTEVSSSTFFDATLDGGAPRSRQEVEAGASETFVMGSHDGRFAQMDRPAVRAGRLPTGDREAVATVAAARAEGIEVGDMIPISFWHTGLGDGLSPEAYQQYATEQIAPLGVEQITIVGIVTLADEVLPDGLYPRQRIIVSRDVAATYDCLGSHAPLGATVRELVEALLPEGCATLYRYYSLSFATGAAGVKPALDEFVRTSTAMNAALAEISEVAGLDPEEGEAPSYFLIPTETAQEVRRVERANRTTVAALLVLGVTCCLVTVVLVGFATTRELRRTATEQRRWHELGISARARATVTAVPLLVAALVGLAVALGAAWVLDTGPVGLVRNIEPHPARRIGLVAVTAVAAIGLAAALLIALLVRRAARRTTRQEGARGHHRVPMVTASVGSPVVVDGMRAVARQPSAVAVVANLAILTAAVTAASVFATSLTRLTSTPNLYGWPWDLAAMTGAGYGDLDLDAAREAFGSAPDVASWSALGFINQVTLDGEPMMTVFGFERTSGSDLTVLEGALPDEVDEVAIGATTAQDRGLAVGDEVEIGGELPQVRATITGLVVFPALGPLMADRVGTGTGMLIPEAILDDPELAGEAESARMLATFVGISLAGTADAATVVRVRDELRGLDLLGAPANVYVDPVQPPEIVDVRSTRTVPVMVAAIFAAVGVIAIGLASWSSVRSRRRDLAVLRAFGFTRAQVRGSVHVQSAVTVLCGLAIGVPCGIIVGRALWRAFADELGVVPDAAGAIGPIALVAAGGVIIAVLAALLPARMAIATSPAAGLRAE